MLINVSFGFVVLSLLSSIVSGIQNWQKCFTNSFLDVKHSGVLEVKMRSFQRKHKNDRLF